MRQEGQEQANQEERTVIGQPEPICQVISPPFRADDLTAAIEQVLKKHGGRLEVSDDAFTLHFPKGTIMQELYPRVNFSRFRITFPDGYEIMRTVDGQGNTFNLSFPEEDIPEEIRRRYQRCR
jgi:hypothetical protein